MPERWRNDVVVALFVLVGFGLFSIIFGINAFWAAAGIVAGVGLAGLWSPSSPRTPPSPQEGDPDPCEADVEATYNIAPQPFSKLGRTAVRSSFANEIWTPIGPQSHLALVFLYARNRRVCSSFM
jgi:hypothetical protein